jgi:hypothetical protein
MQKPHVIKGKEIDCKSQLPPPKKRQSQFQVGGSWNGRGDYDDGFEGKYINVAAAVVYFCIH